MYRWNGRQPQVEVIGINNPDVTPPPFRSAVTLPDSGVRPTSRGNEHESRRLRIDVERIVRTSRVVLLCFGAGFTSSSKLPARGTSRHPVVAVGVVDLGVPPLEDDAVLHPGRKTSDVGCGC